MNSYTYMERLQKLSILAVLFWTLPLKSILKNGNSLLRGKEEKRGKHKGIVIQFL